MSVVDEVNTSTSTVGLNDSIVLLSPNVVTLPSARVAPITIQSSITNCKHQDTERIRLFPNPSYSGNETIDLTDDGDFGNLPYIGTYAKVSPILKVDPETEKDEVIFLSDEEDDSKGDSMNSRTQQRSKELEKTKSRDSDVEVEIVAVKIISPSDLKKSPVKLKNRWSSLSFNSVKAAADKVKKRVSSSNLQRIQSHTISKKKTKRISQSFCNQISQIRPLRAKLPQRRQTTPIYNLDMELGPANPNYRKLRSRFKGRPFTSAWPNFLPPFIPTSNSNLPNSTLPQEPNFINVANFEIKTPGSLRTIVIDGSNVAMGHRGNRIFSCKGIKICAEFFLRRGHEVVALVPQFRRKQSESMDTEILEAMERDGIVKFTPSRDVAGKRIVPYDDRFIVELAHLKDGIIISNDNFKDIYNEKKEWRDTIKFRILNFVWVDENLIIFPEDPLGRTGPTLQEFLRF